MFKLISILIHGVSLLSNIWPQCWCIKEDEIVMSLFWFLYATFDGQKTPFYPILPNISTLLTLYFCPYVPSHSTFYLPTTKLSIKKNYLLPEYFGFSMKNISVDKESTR